MVRATVDIWVKPENEEIWRQGDPTVTLTTLCETIYYAKNESFNKLRAYLRNNQITDCYYEVIIEEDNKYVDSDEGYLENGVFYLA